jgi:thioredoxin reductase (NADPH)
VKKPVILVIDPEGGDAPTGRELAARYSGDYTIVVTTESGGALDHLRGLADRSDDLALFLADRQVAAESAVLDIARSRHPHARRGLLLAWNEHRTHREQIAAAFAQRQAECVVTRPTGTPDERFHRSITELLDEWWRGRGSHAADIVIVGPARSARVSEICDVLHRHDMPFAFHPSDSQAGAAILETANVSTADVPVVTLRNGRTLVGPTNVELADALGARTRPGAGVFDVIVVGGGPAGLSAAVYAKSEGLRTGLIEPTAMGGQAGTSSMIRNYLGFPRGISGAELAARAFEQAILFGTEMIYGTAASGLRAEGDLRVVRLANGIDVTGLSVVIATGVSYRTLDIPALDDFNGVGVFYGSAMSEAATVVGQPALVVGGGNSAGQAALYLAKFASRVSLLVRSDSLASSMSDYLITEISATPNIEVQFEAEVVGGAGDGRLEQVDVRHRRSGSIETMPAAAMFILIGAQPFTSWLPSEIARDDWGYVVTGPSEQHPRRLPFESTMPGVFAVGDVRCDSVKRVASAVGEGAVCVRLVHEYLSVLGR